MDLIFVEHIEKGRYKELSDSLSNQVVDLRIVVVTKAELEETLRKELRAVKDKSDAGDMYVKAIEKKLKKVERKLRWAKTGLVVVSVLCVVALII